MPPEPTPLPPFEAPYAPDDRAMAARLLAAAGMGAEREARSTARRRA